MAYEETYDRMKA
jgi:hypothetical protein